MLVGVDMVYRAVPRPAKQCAVRVREYAVSLMVVDGLDVEERNVEVNGMGNVCSFSRVRYA